MIRTATLAILSYAVLLAESLTPGTYKGQYQGSAGASGEFRVVLAKGAGDEWKAEVSFVLSGQDVKSKVTSVQVNGAKLKIVYQFDLQGTMLESTIDGELAESKISGKYHTQVAGDGQGVDDGTWSASTSAN